MSKEFTGKCFRCGKLHNVNDHIATSEGFYCCKNCAMLSLLEKIKMLETEVYKLIMNG